MRRFVGQFTSNILISLHTPRLAVRYGNSLSFSMPLLYHEANMVDLMLIEAVKIFYPEHYKFIKSYPEYFIGSYSKLHSYGVDEDKKKSFKESFEEVSKGITKKQKNCIQNLLQELFPRLKEVFQNYSYGYEGENKWFKEKRIASAKYFNRYFSYVVIKGDISDIAFQELLKEISTKSAQETIASIKNLVDQSSPTTFLQKIRSFEDDFDWNTSLRISKAIAASSNIFPQRDNEFMMRFEIPNTQAAIFICQLLKRHNNKAENFTLAKELLIEASSFTFAYELDHWYKVGERDEDKIFNQEQYSELSMILVNRALRESNDIPLFEKYPDHGAYILGLWSDFDKQAVEKYLKKIINKDPRKSLDLLRVFAPTGYSTAVLGPYKTDLGKEEFDFLTSILDKNYINEKIKKAFSESEIQKEEVIWTRREKGQTDMNIIRQFRHWLTNETNTDN